MRIQCLIKPRIFSKGFFYGKCGRNAIEGFSNRSIGKGKTSRLVFKKKIRNHSPPSHGHRDLINHTKAKNPYVPTDSSR